MCGEKAAYLRAVWVPKGLPPRVRGKERQQARKHRVTRITPACAGKSNWKHRRSSKKRDYPRVCGEKQSGGRCLPVNKGLPPRVRGKGKRGTAGESVTGITPACAGKSYTVLRLLGWLRDYPRVCGEKSFCLTNR